MTCKICDGSGLIPFVKSDGKVSVHAKIFCECHEENKHAYSPPLQPSDIDFPISHNTYRALCQEHGWPDSGAERPPDRQDAPQVVEHIVRTSSMNHRDFRELKETANKVTGLMKKVFEDKRIVGKQYTIK
ncbi:hypothetical protein LCGC14_2836500 [marine sediment metagenome]|uniref:Uncharacterized protein n=1 Tax=marine sediment metagenome TaxID=412755 RepID=A0A0F8YZ39_9ZZZZ